MGIEVSCDNGHRLKVKDSFAGKTGYCPICHARVKVPKPETPLSEDDILGVLGDPSAETTSRAERAPIIDSRFYGDGLSVPPSAKPAQRTCPKCEKPIGYQYSARCPRCGAVLPKVEDAWSGWQSK